MAYSFFYIFRSQEATLTASTVWGAMHGLETFTQLIEQSNNKQQQHSGQGELLINWAPLRIEDSPRYVSNSLPCLL